MGLNTYWTPMSSLACMNTALTFWHYCKAKGCKKISIKECAYSSITRMELLSYPALTPVDKQAIESLLKCMVYLAITPEIENETIEFRSRYKTKLPDSIIAATAKHHQLELLTLDKKLAAKL